MADVIADQLAQDTQHLWRDTDSIRQDLLNDARQTLPAITNYNAGGVVRTILEIFARAVLQFYVLLSNVLRQCFVQTAEGEWLDLKAGEIGLTRKAATQATGLVRFGRTATSGNVVIPSGTILQTPIDTQGRRYRFFTSEERVLTTGNLQVSVPVTAEFPGAEYNVGGGTITELVSSVPGVTQVTNLPDWVTREGTDAETDPELRERYRLKWEELAQGATKMAYVGYAKEVNGVVDVEVDDHWPRGQGTVDVYITGTAGMPTQALLDEVQAVVNDRKPICSDARVLAPTAVPVNTTVHLFVLPGTPGQTEMAATASAVINALFILDDTYQVDDLRFRIGQDVTQDRIILALARHVPNLKRVDAGFTYIPVAISQMANRGNILVVVSEEAA